MIVEAAASRGEEHVDALGGGAQLVDARNFTADTALGSSPLSTMHTSSSSFSASAAPAAAPITPGPPAGFRSYEEGPQAALPSAPKIMGGSRSG